jgi:hypothetical protein
MADLHHLGRSEGRRWGAAAGRCGERASV